MGVSGCHIVFPGGGDDLNPWIGAQNIITGRLIGQDHPMFIKSTKENLRFTLVFSLLDDKFTPIINYNLGKIFGKSVPVPLEISDDRTKMIYVLPVNQININDSFGGRGHFSIDFQATTPHWLTPVRTITRQLRAGDALSVTNESNVQNSDGTYNVYPHLTFTALNSTFEMIHISNKNNPNRRIRFSGLTIGEIIEMDCRLKQIKSSTGSNRFPNWGYNMVENGVTRRVREVFWLHEGVNRFRATNNCAVKIVAQYPVYQ
jgi:phage-related protein